MRSRTFRPQIESLDDRWLPSFTPGGAFSTGSVPAAIVNADFNNDGRLDLATANGWAGTVGVLLGTGDGRFGVPTQAAAYTPFNLNVGDFNGDGNTDLVTQYHDSWGSPEGGYVSGYGVVGVHLGNGDGTFQNAVDVHSSALPSQPIPETVLVADVNGDGRSDLGIHGWYPYSFGGPYDPFPQRPEYFVVLLGSADGTFTQTYRDPSEFPPAPAPDFNGDGFGDKLEFGYQGLGVRLGLPDGTFGPPEYHLQGQFPTAVSVGDFTGDGRPDVVAATYESENLLVLVKGDRLPEANETFVVNLSNASNATIADGQGVGTITDDEPQISISDVTKSEGKKGKTTLFTFTASLSIAYDQPVTVSFKTTNGTATTGNSDYAAKTGTITFAPGETTKTITIEVKGDSRRESNEYFYLDLSGNSTNSWFAKNRGVGTIQNDD